MDPQMGCENKNPWDRQGPGVEGPLEPDMSSLLRSVASGCDTIPEFLVRVTA